MEIKFKRSFKLVDNGDLTQNLHSLCYQNNTLISEVDLGNVEDILTQLKKQQEIIDKAIDFIKNGDLLYFANKNSVVYRDNVEIKAVADRLNDLLEILEDKEV